MVNILGSSQWIAVSTAMYIAHALVADASEPHSLASLLNHFVSMTSVYFFSVCTSYDSLTRLFLQDFHMVLVPNPDGYVYTWEHDRLWYVRSTIYEQPCELRNTGTRTGRTSVQLRGVLVSI